MKSRSLSFSLLSLLLITVMACGPAGKQAVQQKIDNTRAHFAPDDRVALFEVSAEPANGGWLLTGETNLPEAKAALMDSLSSMNISVEDSIRVLPEAELGGKTYAVVNNSVANLRSRPSHPAQLVTQATLGMPLKVLKKRGSWYFVQTPDDYLAWVDYGGLHTMTAGEYEEWKSAPKMIYLDTYGTAYKQPSREASKVSDLVSGSILKVIESRPQYYRVRYPDGRTAYVSREEARDFESWKKSVQLTEDQLVETAKSMKGAPYLWGGTSSKGMDCSGFTKTIYFMNGWIIPRDASQQVKAGKAIDTSEGFGNLRPGDLLFFGTPATDSTEQRVVHVGMWIGNKEFIHSAGRVKISSVDPQAENYDEYNLNRFLEAKRYLEHKKGNILEVEDMYNI